MKKIDLEKIGPVGTYDTHNEMQITLRSMKWKGTDDPIVVDIIQTQKITSSIQKDVKGKDTLRRSILDLLDTISLRDQVFKKLVEEGYDSDLIESTIDELITKGLVYSPRYSILRRT